MDNRKDHRRARGVGLRLLRSLLPSGVLACAPKTPNLPAPPAPCAELVVVEHGPFFASATLRVEDCPMVELPTLRDVWAALPNRYHSLPPFARLTIIGPTDYMALGPGPSDSQRTFARIEFPNEGQAIAWATTQLPSAAELPFSTELATYRPPLPWPVHPESPNHEPEAPAPAYWPPLDKPGTLWIRQKPAEFEPCANYGVKGELFFRDGPILYHHTFYEQWFYPEGGCGG